MHFNQGDVSLDEQADFFRLDVLRQVGREQRKALGQFFTPPDVAQFMAAMFDFEKTEIRLLDAGAGVGSLTAAVVNKVCALECRPKNITVVAYEIDSFVIPYLADTLTLCRKKAASYGINLTFEILEEDFIDSAVDQVGGGLFVPEEKRFNFAILNPPYKKLSAKSHTRARLKSVGIEATNIYSAFCSMAILMLEPKGQLVAITPRSFSNGPYFKPFRRLLADEMTLNRIHLFGSRSTAFSDDDVLQENVIIHATKEKQNGKTTWITSSDTPSDPVFSTRTVRPEEIIQPGDRDYFIHIVPDELEQSLAEFADRFTSSLEDLGIAVSTGRVVDFRAADYLRNKESDNTVPLIYPNAISDGGVNWPKPNGKKPQHIIHEERTRGLLVPSGYYVIVKRFTSKEENKRVVAGMLDPTVIRNGLIGLENHVNFFHQHGKGITPELAKGLVIYLNSTLIDSYLRNFSGHTQVNATDLRRLPYPNAEQLKRFGAFFDGVLPTQGQLDNYVEQEIIEMANKPKSRRPLSAKTKIRQALGILKNLGLPKQQQNERSALTLLALLGLKPGTPWKNAKSVPLGITPIMDFISKHYGKKYAPNTRETIRRHTVHQFVQAEMVLENPDDPSRPPNSPKTVYKCTHQMVNVIRTYRSSKWEQSLKRYLATVAPLADKYARERKMKKIPLKLPSGETIALSAGGQNKLVKEIIEKFCPRFTPGGVPVYVGDARKKWAYFQEQLLTKLGVSIDAHGKIPDVIVYYKAKKWLVLIEAVTSHGPIDPKRRVELEKLFKASKVGLVFVTAFSDKRTMVKYLQDISWETEVWIAETSTHMIHFNGERFLGPY